MAALQDRGDPFPENRMPFLCVSAVLTLKVFAACVDFQPANHANDTNEEDSFE